MRYVTGRCAFGVIDDTPSVGIWNIRKSDFLGEGFIERDSEDSIFGDWGIQKNVLIPYREFCTFNVANHVRAYCDMLEMGMMTDMKGLFAEAIDNAKCRLDIFTLVYGKMRNTELFEFVNIFFLEEFGSDWTSYKDAVNKSADKLSKSVDAYEKMVNDKKAYTSLRDKLINPPEEYLEG